MKRLAIFTIMLAAISIGGAASADVIELDNGEVLRGDLIEMSAKDVKFRHEILGEITIPRDRIHAIVMPKAKLKRGGVPRAKERSPEDGPETPKEVIDRLVNKEFDAESVRRMGEKGKQHNSPQDALEQLRHEGVPAGLDDQLRLALPGFGAPKVQDYYQSRVKGLIDGSMGISDIRKDAINARDQLQSLMDDLGPDAGTLSGYMGILEGFIQKTAPNQPELDRDLAPTKPKP